jgi:hypothetical protein
LGSYGYRVEVDTVTLCSTKRTHGAVRKSRTGTEVNVNWKRTLPRHNQKVMSFVQVAVDLRLALYDPREVKENLFRR